MFEDKAYKERLFFTRTEYEALNVVFKVIL